MLPLCITTALYMLTTRRFSIVKRERERKKQGELSIRFVLNGGLIVFFFNCGMPHFMELFFSSNVIVVIIRISVQGNFRRRRQCHRQSLFNGCQGSWPLLIGVPLLYFTQSTIKYLSTIYWVKLAPHSFHYDSPCIKKTHFKNI